MESASWASASSSKRRRGCSGFGTISWTETASCPAGGVGAIAPSGPGNNASIPLPNAFRITPSSPRMLSLSFYALRRRRALVRGGGGRGHRQLAGERPVRRRSARARVVHDHGHAVAWALRNPHVSRDDGPEDLV